MQVPTGTSALARRSSADKQTANRVQPIAVSHIAPCSAARHASAGARAPARAPAVTSPGSPSVPQSWTEGIPIVLDDAAQLADQHFGLYVVQFKFHTLEMGALINSC
jgi:hypothetical protein